MWSLQQKQLKISCTWLEVLKSGIRPLWCSESRMSSPEPRRAALIALASVSVSHVVFVDCGWRVWINWPPLCKARTLEQKSNTEECNEWLEKHFTAAQRFTGRRRKICSRTLSLFMESYCMNHGSVIIQCQTYA